MVTKGTSTKMDESSGIIIVAIIPVLFLLVLCLLISVLIRKKQWTFFPETAGTVSVGILTGLFFYLSRYQAAIRISSDIFYIVLLPPIMFDAGFGMRRVNFFKNFYVISSLAFLGTCYSLLVSGILLYILSKFVYPITFLEAMTFGAMLSATDPVSVLATLNQMPIGKTLYILVFGESALNDATALILFRFITSFANPELQMSFGGVLLSILESVTLMIGSAAIGILVGMALAKLTKHLNLKHGGYETTEISILFVFAYASYLLAEVADMSGIVSILFCGISTSHYVCDNLSPEGDQGAKVNIS